MECPICCEKFTRVTRKEIKCQSTGCGQSVCVACFKRFLSGEDISPKCMFCTKDISYSFVRDVTTKQWSNGDYLGVRADHLMSREKSLLPQSQVDVKEELERRERTRKVNAIDMEIAGLLNQISKLEVDKHRIMYSTPKKTRREVVTLRRCPDEVCKGFLEGDWKCGICKIKACSKCGVKKEDEHECDEDTKATFQLIRDETRPCPKCAIPIHKWEGCNQMYCTQCSCMFDYRTGRLETGFFHNPHYFDAIRTGAINNTERNGQGCDANARPNNTTFTRYSHWFASLIVYTDTRDKFVKLQNLVPLINHIGDIALRQYDVNTFDETCRTMRRKFLMDELKEDDWLKKLKTIEKRREKNKEVYQILELLRDVGRDIVSNIAIYYDELGPVSREIVLRRGRFTTGRTTPDPEILKAKMTVNGKSVNIKDMVILQIEQMENMIDFANTKFSKFESQFNNKFPFIDPSWRQYKCKGL
jgi:hypothetical protein